MMSERLQRRIDQLLDEADAAMAQLEWQTVLDRAQAVLAADPENKDGLAYRAMAERGLSAAGQAPASQVAAPMQAADRDPTQPATFANGRYLVKRFLGEGGKKRVYLAQDSLLDRDVAFALIKTEGLDDVGRQRVTREAQAMGRLGTHPNIVSVFDLGEEVVPDSNNLTLGRTTSQTYIVTELMGGGDVEGLIETAPEHRIPLDDALQIGIEVSRGLEFAHSMNIVHRDLKPGNVWLTSDHIAKIGDFGLAVATDRSRLTQAGMMVGTVSYMPPEQAMGGEVDPRSDLYSLGAMLYELVTGRPPFLGQDSIAIITQHLNAPPVNPSQHRPDLPAGLDGLIMRLLEKDPNRRPASASQVREALEALRAGKTPVLDAPVAGNQSHDGVRLAFVGRQQELSQLQAAFEGAAASRGALAMVIGEPGIGKSTLCEHLTAYVTAHGGQVLIGHCYEDGARSYPYLPFVEALRTYVLKRAPDDLRRELGSVAADLAALVPELRERLRIEPRALENSDSDRWRLLEAVTSFLRIAAAEQPLLLLLEDLHWADKGTLDQLLHLSRSLAGSRMLLAGTYRDIEVDRTHPLSAALAELRRLGSFLRVPLRGLSVDEVQRMVSLIGGSEVTPKRAATIHTETDGNPLFVQEMYRHLLEGGERPSDDTLEQVRVGIPEGIRDMIGKRLAGVSERTSQVLSTAAVLGRTFNLDVLQRLAGLSEDEVIAALEEATEQSIVEEQRAAALGVTYRFSHAFFRELLYEEMSVMRRMRLHQQVARQLEQFYGRRLDEHAAELAEHFAHSADVGDLRKALEFSEVAARQATERKAHGEAAVHLRRALQAARAFDGDNATKLVDLTLALGRSLIAGGESLYVAESIAESALRLATGRGDHPRIRASIRLGIAAAWTYGGAAAFATPLGASWARRGRELVSTGAPEAADVGLAEGLAAFSRGEYRSAQEAIRAAVRSSRQAADAPRLAMAGASLLHLVSPSTWEEASSLYSELVALDNERLEAEVRAPLLFHLGEFALASGDRPAAERHWRRLGELVTTSGDQPLAVLSDQMATVLPEMIEGHLGNAVLLAQSARNRAQDLGSSLLGEYLATLLMTRPMLDIGRTEDAWGLLHDGGKTAWGAPHQALAGLTSALHAGGGAASQSLPPALGNDELAFAPVRVLLSLLMMAFARGEQAPRLAEALAPCGATCDGLSGIQLARLQGEAMRFAGDRGAAATLLRAAAAGGVACRPERALTHLALAETLLDSDPGNRDEAIGHLDTAISELRDMRMRPALERALSRRDLLKA